MKKTLILAAIAATLAGCSYQAYDQLYYTDFTRYSKYGVFVSSIADYAGSPYIALGDIAIRAVDSGDFTPIPLEPQQVLDKVVAAAKQKGANGVLGYTAHYTPGGRNGRGYWYATGVAVKFEENSKIVKSADVLKYQLNEAPAPATADRTAEYDSLLQKQKEEIAKRTANYLIENKKRFIQWTPVDGDLYFDVVEKKYISEKDFDKKYGDDTRYAIEAMYKDLRKSQKKSTKQQ